jgi:putative heme-binding domain-containing protein
MTPAAADAQKARALSASVSDELRALAIDALAFTRDEKAAEALIAVAAALPADASLRNNATYWLGKRMDDEWEEFALREKLDAAGLQSVGKTQKLASSTVPAPTPEQQKALTVEAVLKLTGDAARGKIAAQRCVLCHKVGTQGVDYGPSLVGWGLAQPPNVIAESIIEPSKTIAHGFDGMEVKTKDGLTIHGIKGATGKVVPYRVTGGAEMKILKKDITSEKPLGRSLMLSAAQLGCTAQDVADIVAYLRAGGK